MAEIATGGGRSQIRDCIDRLWRVDDGPGSLTDSEVTTSQACGFVPLAKSRLVMTKPALTDG